MMPDVRCTSFGIFTMCLFHFSVRLPVKKISQDGVTHGNMKCAWTGLIVLRRKFVVKLRLHSGSPLAADTAV